MTQVFNQMLGCLIIAAGIGGVGEQVLHHLLEREGVGARPRRQARGPSRSRPVTT